MRRTSTSSQTSSSKRINLSQQRQYQHGFGGLLLVAAVLATAAALPVISAIQPRQQQQQQQKLISLALIPHHEQVRRRKLEAARLNRRWLGDDIPTGIHRVSRRRRTEAQVLDALYQGYGTHYVDLWCGTPTVQRQTVIVDTGSGVTAFPCVGCENCGDDGHHTDSLFNQSESESFHAMSCAECQRGHCEAGSNGEDGDCRISMSYQEGSSWSAFESLDICYAGGAHDRPLAVSEKEADSTAPPKTDKDDADLSVASSFAIPMMFGCQTHLTGLFRTQLADGIMGMDNADTAFWSQMHKAGKIKDKLFSLCFSRQNKVNRQGTEAGAMTLGGSDPRLHTSPMVYTSAPNGFSGIGFYPVHMRHVYLRQGGGGDSATALQEFRVMRIDVSEESLNSGGMIIVDSGTTDTYFSSVLRGAFDTAWKELTGKSYDHNPAKLTAEQVDQLPTILFQLAGDEAMNSELAKTAAEGTAITGLAGALDPEHPLDLILAMPPSHYMEYDDRDDMYVARFYMDGSGNVLGANAIMGHDVMFDVANSRIGWAESPCDYTKLLATADLPNPEEESVETAKKDKQEVTEESPNGEGSGGEGSESGGDGGEEGLSDPETDDFDGSDGSTAAVSETKTEKSSSYSLASLSESCSSTKCRGGIAGGVLGSVLLLALLVRRVSASRRRAPAPRREYQLTSELELSNVVAEEDDDFVHYRDRQPNGGYDDDEMPSPPEIN